MFIIFNKSHDRNLIIEAKGCDNFICRINLGSAAIHYYPIGHSSPFTHQAEISAVDEFFHRINIAVACMKTIQTIVFSDRFPIFIYNARRYREGSLNVGVIKQFYSVHTSSGNPGKLFNGFSTDRILFFNNRELHFKLCFRILLRHIHQLFAIAFLRNDQIDIKQSGKDFKICPLRQYKILRTWMVFIILDQKGLEFFLSFSI